MTTEKVRLHTLLADYPNTLALKTGRLKSDLVTFDFADVKVSNTAFKPLVRDAKFDVGELAITTYLLAKAFGKPYVLLPAVVVGRGQLHTVAYNPERGHLDPRDLKGRRVGVRSYTVTTGVWVRGMLEEQYGVSPDSVRWVTFEDPHVAEYKDPPSVERAPTGKTLVEMLLDGEIDAGVVGDKLPDPRLKHLVPDADKVSEQWARTHGGVPINHLVVIRESIAKSRPDVVKEVYRLLRDSRAATPWTGEAALDPLRFGIGANRRTLEVIIEYASRQHLIPRRYTVDELFSEVRDALGE
jgi:4,5-dihydroxyphthalate decarboxylase